MCSQVLVQNLSKAHRSSRIWRTEVRIFISERKSEQTNPPTIAGAKLEASSIGPVGKVTKDQT